MRFGPVATLEDEPMTIGKFTYSWPISAREARSKQRVRSAAADQ
jgi:hypothetical protein